MINRFDELNSPAERLDSGLGGGQQLQTVRSKTWFKTVI
jgi:hypothetical protein